MSDAAIFIIVFSALFVLRLVIATIVFTLILPDGDRCPNCDAVTLPVRSAGWNRLMPWFRTSWCMDCGWDGLHRRGPRAPSPAPVAEHQLTEPRSRR